MTLDDKGGSISCSNIFDASITFDCTFDANENQILINNYFDLSNKGFVSLHISASNLELGDSLSLSINSPNNFFQSLSSSNIQATPILTNDQIEPCEDSYFSSPLSAYPSCYKCQPGCQVCHDVGACDSCYEDENGNNTFTWNGMCGSTADGTCPVITGYEGVEANDLRQC